MRRSRGKHESGDILESKINVLERREVAVSSDILAPVALLRIALLLPP